MRTSAAACWKRSAWGWTSRPTRLWRAGNFATVDRDGLLLDRRAGRIPTAAGERICALLARRIEAAGGVLGDGVRIEVHPGEAYRFVLLFRAAEGTPPLDAGLPDTDPQRLGVPPLAACGGHGLERRWRRGRWLPATAVTAPTRRPPGRPPAGSGRPSRPSSGNCAGRSAPTRFCSGASPACRRCPASASCTACARPALAGYPLYRGVAKVCGMDVVDCGKPFEQILGRLEERWSDFDYFFLHVKGADMAGEDGDPAAKVAVIEEVDALLPRLLELAPDVLAITGDHSTPAPMKAHSWHPVPLLVSSELCFVDDCDALHRGGGDSRSRGHDPVERVDGAVAGERRQAGEVRGVTPLGVVTGCAGLLAGSASGSWPAPPKAAGSNVAGLGQGGCCSAYPPSRDKVAQPSLPL